jgi:cellobiose phosphorylase
LQIRPSIPREWTQVQINYRFGTSLYHILIKQQDGLREQDRSTLDGKDLAEGMITLKDDGETHEVIVYM